MRACDLGVALATALFLTSGVQAQPLHKVGGPAELPPASYSGTQYVDSRGCVYIRAGFDGAVEWVPRVTRSRKLMCGFKPTMQAAAKTRKQPAVAASTPATAPASKPATPVQAAATPERPQKSMRQPAPAAAAVQPAPTRIVVTAPKPAPIFVPKGYKFAWTDDRLNPRRGQGTKAGQAAMDQVWTRDVPAKLVKPKPVQVTRSVQKPTRLTTAQISTRSQPAATQGQRFVQVGMFAVPANSKRTIAKLRSLGLPVAVSQRTIKGRAVKSVMAGPFATATDLQAALKAAKKAGFADAFLR